MSAHGYLLTEHGRYGEYITLDAPNVRGGY